MLSLQAKALLNYLLSDRSLKPLTKCVANHKYSHLNIKTDTLTERILINIKVLSVKLNKLIF